jgi:ribosomal protein L37AE/L43A
MDKKVRKKGFERHLVPCPKCGKDILDHMSQCPFCKAAVSPSAYQPMNPDQQRKIKLVLTVVLCILAGILLLFAKCGGAA